MVTCECTSQFRSARFSHDCFCMACWKQVAFDEDFAHASHVPSNQLSTGLASYDTQHIGVKMRCDATKKKSQNSELCPVHWSISQRYPNPTSWTFSSFLFQGHWHICVGDRGGQNGAGILPRDLVWRIWALVRLASESYLCRQGALVCRLCAHVYIQFT